jgi:hypothetical protein
MVDDECIESLARIRLCCACLRCRQRVCVIRCCMLQVVMKLLDNLRGVSPATYPKHPVAILSRITIKLGLSTVRFALDTAVTSGAGGARYRGRARLRNMWLSDILVGHSRFAVRTKCAEEALQQLRHDPHWLNQLSLDEDGTFALNDVMATAQAASMPGAPSAACTSAAPGDTNAGDKADGDGGRVPPAEGAAGVSSAGEGTATGAEHGPPAGTAVSSVDGAAQGGAAGGKEQLGNGTQPNAPRAEICAGAWGGTGDEQQRNGKLKAASEAGNGLATPPVAASGVEASGGANASPAATIVHVTVSADGSAANGKAAGGGKRVRFEGDVTTDALTTDQGDARIAEAAAVQEASGAAANGAPDAGTAGSKPAAAPVRRAAPGADVMLSLVPRTLSSSYMQHASGTMPACAAAAGTLLCLLCVKVQDRLES